jgi:anti-sigma B factor antagonist
MDIISIDVGEHPQNKAITLLTIKGVIDTRSVAEFEEKFLSVLREKKFKLVVDLREVGYISSAGWGIFISQIKKIRTQEGDLLLVGMSPAVSEIFKLLEFNTFLKSFPDVESAVKKGFKNPAPPIRPVGLRTGGQKGKSAYR